MLTRAARAFRKHCKNPLFGVAAIHHSSPQLVHHSSPTQCPNIATKAEQRRLRGHGTLPSAPATNVDSARKSPSIPKSRRVQDASPSVKTDNPTALSAAALCAVENLLARVSSQAAIMKHIQNSSILSEYLMDRDKARRVAEAMAHTNTPQRSLRVLLWAHRLGCQLKQSAYECVAHQLAEGRHWHLIPLLVAQGKRETGRTTVRLLNWRARAFAGRQNYHALDGVLAEFEQENLKPTQRTFHILISAHVRNQHLAKAKSYLDEMEKAGIPVDASTHAMVVSSYRSLGSDRQVESQALEILRDLPNHSATTVLNNIAQMRLDAHDVPGAIEALSLFRQTTPLLRAAVGARSTQDDGNGETAGIRVANDSAGLSISPSPNAVTFSILLNFMVKRNDLPGALDILAKMAAASVQPSTGIVAAVIRVYCTTGDDSTAVGIVAGMCARNNVPFRMFSSLISGPIPAEFPLNTSGVPLTVEIFNALLRGIIRSQGFPGATTILRIMRASGVTPDAVSAEIVLAYMDKVEHARPRVLLRTLRQLYQDNITPTLRHVHVIMRSILRREKYLRYGSGWDVTAAKFSPTRHARTRHPDDRISGVSKSFDPTAGVELPRALHYRTLFRPIIQPLLARRVKSDGPTLALRIRHEAVTKADLETARSVFHSLLARGLHPNEYHFSALMEGHANAGDLKGAENIMDSAREAGIQPNVVMYTILIVGYGRQGSPALAMRTFQTMIAHGIKPDVPAIDAVASAFFAVGAYTTTRQLLTTLWSYIQPFPEELHGVPLKILASEFRKLHGNDEGMHKSLSKQRQLMLHWKLRKLLAVWMPDGKKGRISTRHVSSWIFRRKKKS